MPRLVDGKQDAIAALFGGYKPTTMTVPITTKPPVDDKPDGDSNNDDDFSPLVIALIAVAVVLLVAFLVAIIYIYKGRKR